MIRRWFLLGVVAVGLAAAMVVGLASGAKTTGRTAAKTAADLSWLPPGVTPAGADWPTSGGDPASSDYSTLNQINTKNVSKLHVAFQLASLNIPAPGTGYKPENQPIVLTMGSPDASGKPITNLPMKTTMFMQTNYGLVALNPTNGDILWQYKGALTKGNGLLEIGARSISYGDGYIFGGQQDGSLVALDAKTGAPVWTVDTDAAGTTRGREHSWRVEPVVDLRRGFDDEQACAGSRVLGAERWGLVRYAATSTPTTRRRVCSCGGRGTRRIRRRSRSS